MLLHLDKQGVLLTTRERELALTRKSLKIKFSTRVIWKERERKKEISDITVVSLYWHWYNNNNRPFYEDIVSLSLPLLNNLKSILDISTVWLYRYILISTTVVSSWEYFTTLYFDCFIPRYCYLFVFWFIPDVRTVWTPKTWFIIGGKWCTLL